MRRYFTWTVAVAVMLLPIFSCKKSSESDIGSERILKMYSDYTSPDIEVARRGLLDYIDDLHSFTKKGIEVYRSDYGLALSHARLLLICAKLGEEDEAREHFSLYIYHMNKDREFRGLGPVELSPEELIESLETYDMAGVKWFELINAGGENNSRESHSETESSGAE